MKHDITFKRYLCLLLLAVIGSALCDASSAEEPFRDVTKPVEARVEMQAGRPTLMINDVPRPPLIYALGTTVGIRWSWEESQQYTIRLFAERGVRLFHIYVEMDQIWTAPDCFDISLIKRQIQGVLDVCPDAAVMIRLNVNSPPWWNEAHKDECVRYADTQVISTPSKPPTPSYLSDLSPTVRHSLASRVWLRECGDKVAELCRQLADSPEGNAVFAIHIASGVFHEWHYFGFMKHEPDVSKAMNSQFRRWLSEKYKTDTALQDAWNDRNVTLATASVPGVEPRMHTSAGYLRDPIREQRVIDYYRCQHNTVTDSFLTFCQIVKKNWPRPILVGGFHGYWFKMFGRMAAGGHLKIKRALDSPAIDFIAAPQAYGHQALGKSGLSRALVESCRLHGKLFLDEMDDLPAIWRVNSPMTATERNAGDERLTESVAVMCRNIMQPFCRGAGVWYFDLRSVHPHHPTNTCVSMWDHPVLLSKTAKMQAVQSKYIKRKYEPAADVLLVFDTDSFFYSGHNKKIDPFSTELLDGVTEELLHAGAAVDMIYLFDLDRVDLDRYKAVIFANLHKLDDAQREFISTKVARDGRHLVWQCAPGYTDGRKLTPENVSKVTGISLKPARTSKAQVSINAPGIAQVELGNGKAIEPLFAVNDAKATSLGRFKGSDQTAFVRKNLGSHTVWYSSVPLENRAVLRHIIAEAGAHLYSNHHDVIYAGNDLLLIHTADADDRTITLRNGKTITLKQSFPSTFLIDVNTGETLLE